MEFTPLEIPGVYLIEMKLLKDPRGFFTRTFCQKEFEAIGLKNQIVQCNTSWNKDKGTLRGMHYQRAPHAEVKIIRCTRGAIYDVIIDLRKDSPTYCRWVGVELTQDDYKMLYVPEGFAHGYVTLKPDTETIYFVTAAYAPDHEGAVRWDDPAFKIEWPIPEPILSDKDRSHPDYQP